MSPADGPGDEELPLGNPGMVSTSTSRLAIFSVMLALPCIPVLSGLGGVLLGLFALAQIRATSTLEGASLAWLGILGGSLNLAVCAAMGLHVMAVREQVDPAADRFFAAWGQSEQAGEEAASPGLRVEMNKQGKGAALWSDIKERSGGMLGVGERDHFNYGVAVRGGLREDVTGVYPVKTPRGLPFNATLRFATVEDQVRVVGMELSSPILHGTTSLQGSLTPDIGSYDGPSERGKGHMKSYSK